ncbi:unnamed protein product, partial [Vitis vinifera]
MEVGSGQTNLIGIFKELKPNVLLVRNSPKFIVERRNIDTWIEIRCAAKPGSTVNTLELLGLEIQYCVISCFNDFSMQAFFLFFLNFYTYIAKRPSFSRSNGIVSLFAFSILCFWLILTCKGVGQRGIEDVMHYLSKEASNDKVKSILVIVQVTLNSNN